jgi:hypothetical protein
MAILWSNPARLLDPVGAIWLTLLIFQHSLLISQDDVMDEASDAQTKRVRALALIRAVSKPRNRIKICSF